MPMAKGWPNFPVMEVYWWPSGRLIKTDGIYVPRINVANRGG
jgi:hypothetical protein